MPSRDLVDTCSGIVADASVLVNLAASGAAREIAEALPVRLRVVRTVALELERGHPRWTTSEQLTAFEAAKLVEIVDLDSAALGYFEALVVGPASVTLDDGEAATISYAVTRDLMALIDEKKARRICEERFRLLMVGTTIDLLLSAVTKRALGASGVADALFGALQYGRMRVPSSHMKRVVKIVGAERAALCSSLPMHLRTLSK